MKKTAFHILFWFIYLVQDVLLIFLVNVSRQGSTDSVWLAAANGLVILIPKLLLTYFVLNIVLDKMVARGLQNRGIVSALLALVISILLYRWLMVFVIAPYIYDWDSGQSIFYPLGLLVALMDIGFVAGLAIIIKQLRMQFVARERERDLLQEKLQSELRFLRNQTNPHFLFNTLNNIYALARRKSEQAPEAILMLSKMLRFMIYETSKPVIRIEEEVKVLDDFIELQKIRFSDRLTINFYREIDDPYTRISPLLLLPFVENAFKHGPGESRNESYIHIDMVLQGGLLHFKVENNRDSTEALEKKDGIGLRNVKRQLDLLYPAHQLEVKEETETYKISLTVNLEINENDQLPHTRR